MAEIQSAIKVGDVWTNLIDHETGESVNYEVTDTWYDGTPMDDSKCDGVVYRKLPTEVGGGYAVKANWDLSKLVNQEFVSPPKPSKYKVFSEIQSVIREGLQYGGGYFGSVSGAIASDMIYETVKNTLGGTNGTFIIRSRFAIKSPDWNKSGGNLTISVQMGDNVAGVTVGACTFTDDGLSTGGTHQRYALTNTGSGLFSVNFAPNPAWPDLIGVNITMTPQDNRNDASLHQEYWNVRGVKIEQDGNTLLDTSIVDSSNNLFISQTLYTVRGSSFWPETQVLNGKTVYVNHSRFMTGAQVPVCWVSITGSSSGYGLITDPVNLNRAARLSAIGAVNTFLFKDVGEYEYTGVKTTNIFSYTDSSLQLIALNGPVKFKLGHYIDMGSLTWQSGGFYVPYTPTNNYESAAILAGNSSPDLLLYGEMPLIKVGSESLVETTPRSYYWDLPNSRFIVNLPDLLGQLVVPECLNVVNAAYSNYLRIVDVTADASTGSFISQIRGNGTAEIYGSGIVGGTTRSSVFRHEQGGGFLVDCVSIGAGNDGYNFHDWGNWQMFDCIAENSKGDGASPHEDCNLLIVGGEIKNNARAGLIPAYGARCLAYKVNMTDNNLDQLNAYGNAMALSDNSINPYNGSEQKPTVFTIVECNIGGGNYGIISRGPRSNVIDIDSHVTDTLHPISSETQSTGDGFVATTSSSNKVKWNNISNVSFIRNYNK